MENEKQILVVGSSFGVGMTGLTQFAQTKDRKAELIEQIKATGYTFDLQPDELADYLISECDNFNFNNRTSFDYVDFLEAYLNEHPQYKKDIGMPFSGLVSLDTNCGVMPMSYKMEVGKYDIKSTWASFRREPKQKWYNQFQNKRKRK